MRGKNNVVLPAIEAADPGIWPLMNPEPACNAVAPNGSLDMGRLEFPVATENDALTADEQQRAVDATGRIGIAHGNPDDDIDIRPARQTATPCTGDSKQRIAKTGDSE
ncbi:hypothetical protein ASC90_00870 [Rhizobium sp. Root1220]|nr:hypothetical protein ASC90_00870 [Rhizobium sp. Root1220]